MKIKSLEEYKKQLEAFGEGEFPKVFFIVTSDELERREAVELTRSFVDSEQGNRSFQGGQVSHEELFQELNGIPFFGSSQAVVLERADKLSSSLSSALVEYLHSPNPHITFIASSASLPAQSKLLKGADQGGLLLQCVELRPWEKERLIEQWMVKRAQGEGWELEPAAASMMAKQLGTDKLLLAGELEKLICFVGQRKKIGASDVVAVCACVNLETVWQLGEAVLRRDGARAVRIMGQLLEDGASLLSLLYQLRGQVQNGFQICAILQEGGGVSRVQQQFPYMKGKILERNMQLAQGYGMERFQKALLLINKIDLQLKNSQAPAEMVAEYMIARLCQ